MKRIFFLGLICASGVLWFAITQRKAALPTQTQAEPTSENSPTPDSQPQEFANRNQRHPIQIKKRKFSAIPPTQPQNLLRVEAQLEESALQQTIANLISPQTGFSQKQAIWKQLRDEGKLDDVIKELEQRTSGNPNTAEIPTALGQAYVNKIQIATDARDPAILGLKADQSFDAALKLDP
ncbi:MAG: hypothetical protein ABIR24_07580, partial [Verrucomicrobiota bacterium]